MLYTAEFADKLKRAYFLQKVKIANEKLQREERKPQQYYRKHFCENNPSGHDFQPYSPFIGCAKIVCRFCAQESREQTFRAGVYAHKGHSFVKSRKTN